MRNKAGDPVAGRQLGALALTAARVPIYGYCVRFSWPWVLSGSLGAAALLSILTALSNRGPQLRSPEARRGAFGIPAGLLLLTLGLGAAWESARAFPETEGRGLAVGLMLALGLWAATRGPAVPARCAGVLVWITGALCGAVLLFSLPQLRLARLRPAGEALDGLRVLGLMLLPGVIIILKEETREGIIPCWPWWLAALESAAASAVTGGILSPALAAEPGAFRTLARGVSVLGVIRRFEALVNAARLLNAFCLCALLLTAAKRLLTDRRRGVRRETDRQKRFEKNEKKT